MKVAVVRVVLLEGAWNWGSWLVECVKVGQGLIIDY